MDGLMEAVGKAFKEKVKFHTLQVEMNSGYNWRSRDEILDYARYSQVESCETTIGVYDRATQEKVKEAKRKSVGHYGILSTNTLPATTTSICKKHSLSIGLHLSE